MNGNLSHTPSQGPADTAALVRRDRALRLRTRVLLSTVTSAVIAVAGLGVLAEHTYAGHTTTTATGTTSSTSATTPGSSSSSSTSGSSSSNSGSTASTSAPASSSAGTTIVSGGS